MISLNTYFIGRCKCTTLYFHSCIIRKHLKNNKNVETIFLLIIRFLQFYTYLEGLSENKAAKRKIIIIAKKI